MTNLTNAKNQVSFNNTLIGGTLGALVGALIGLVAGLSATIAFGENQVLGLGAMLIFSLVIATIGAILGLFVDLDKNEKEKVIRLEIAKEESAIPENGDNQNKEEFS